MSVRVEGIGRVRQALLQLSGEGAKTVRTEVRRAALNVQAGAKERCPVDTGRLRNSVSVEIDADGLAATVGTNVEYAPYVEFGTVRAAAQPFLFPAFEEERPRFVARIRSAMGGR